MIDRVVQYNANNAVLLFIICLMVMLAAGVGIPKLEISNDYRSYFDSDSPQLIEYQYLQDEFSGSTNIFIVIEALKGNVFERHNLVVIEQMTKKLWETPYSTRVDSLTNFQHAFADQDQLIIEDLFENSSSYSDSELEKRKSVALSELLLKNNLVSLNGKAAGIDVSFNLPVKRDFNYTQESVDWVREFVGKQQQNNPQLKFRLAGELMLNTAFAETSAKDTITLFPAMFAVILVSLGIIFRSISCVLITITVTLFSIITAMGGIGWWGARLTPDGVSAAAMILPIAVADCVHIINRYMQGIRNGLLKEQAIIDSLLGNFRAVLLTSITTAIGFLSLNFSDSPPIRMMGNTVALGVLAACFYSLVLLPICLRWMPIPKINKIPSFLFIGKLADFLISKKQSRLYWVIIVAIPLGSFGIVMNNMDETILNYFSESTEFRQDVDWIQDNLTGVTRVEILFKSNSKNNTNSAQYLKELDQFSGWLRSQKSVISVTAYSDIIKRLNKAMHADDPDYYRIPEDTQLASQYGLLYELSLPLGLELTNQVNFDKSITRVVVSLKKLSDQEVVAFDGLVKNWFYQNLSESRWSSVAGSAVMFAYQLERNVGSVLIGLVLALVLISLVLVFVLRSLKLGLISLVPNLIPSAMAFGIWGLAVGEIGLAMSVVMGMTLGIVVDDTVHFMLKYTEARKIKKQSSEQAVRYAFDNVGSAIFTTTFVLCIAFSMLSISSFEPNANLGVMAALTFGIALIVDLIFLPVLLLRFDRN